MGDLDFGLSRGRSLAVVKLVRYELERESVTRALKFDLHRLNPDRFR